MRLPCSSARLGSGLGLVLGWLSSGCPSGTFACSNDAECLEGEGDAWCEANGHCSFPSESCPSGRRYGEHSPPELAGQCVELPSSTSSGSDADTSVPLTTGTTDGADSTGPILPTTGDPGELVFVDDEWDGEFAAGSVEGLTWDGTAVRLAKGSSEGVLTSRPFDAEGPASWISLSWWARAPYGKPLPDDGAAEQGYAEDGIDMRGNLLLLHLDFDSGPVDDGTVVPDASGTGHDAVVDGSGASSTMGRFGNGLADASTSRLLVDPADFQPNDGDFSWALWVRVAGDCSGSPAMIGLDDAITTDSPNIWLACIDAPSFGPCSGDQGGRVAFVVSGTQTPGGGGAVCSNANIDDGQWHHVVGTKQDHTPATVRVYVDGVLEDETMAIIDGPLSFPDNVELSIGAHPGDTFPLEGSLDEIAIWSRALSTEEVGALYRRGVLWLSIGVRTCDEPSCSNPSPFSGPNGSSDPFVELPQALGPGTIRELMLDGPVLQYQARLQSTAPGLSPGLETVMVTAQRP